MTERGESELVREGEGGGGRVKRRYPHFSTPEHSLIALQTV